MDKQQESFFTLYDGDDTTINLDCDGDKGTLTLHTWHGSSEVEISEELYELMKKELHGKL